MMPELSGRVAVVTGAGNGIGRAMVRLLARSGVSIFGVDLEPDALTSLREELAASGAEIETMTCDLTDPTAADEVRAGALRAFGHVELLFNIAGVTAVGSSVVESDAADWAWTYEVNVLAVVRMLRQFVPMFTSQGEGHVVNASSVAAFVGHAFNGPYCASKAAVLSISESLALEMIADRTGVGVTVLCSGSVQTTIGESERRRSPRFGRSGSGSRRPEIMSMLQAARARGISAEEVASATLEAVREGRFLVLTHANDELMNARSQLASSNVWPASLLPPVDGESA